MKLKTVLRLTFAISLSAADAVGLTIIDHTAQLRKRLEIRRSDGAFPIGNDYNALVQAVWETKGLPRSAVHTAILAEAEESNAQLKFGAPRWDQGGRNWSCINMLTFMRQSGDRGFLPCIEKLGMESACWSVREAALQTHVAMCGFDSFPFVKRAVEAAEVFPVSESVRSVRGRMVETFLGLSPLSEEQITEVCRWLLELTGISDDALLLRMCDRFLRTHLPEYAYSRQRFLLASREDLSPVDPLGQCREHFAAVGVAALLAAALALLRKRTRHQSFRQKGQP